MVFLFTDVSKNSWYYDTVKYTYENNLISGANEYEFRPDAKITRGMIVTILWRMEGKPKVTGIKRLYRCNRSVLLQCSKMGSKE